jgi:protoporphyrinogen oxidase
VTATGETPLTRDALTHDVCIVGAGFTGLAAGMALARAGRSVLVVEGDSQPGGLAGAFQFSDGVTVEKFYHHWFNSDIYLPEVIGELGLSDRILTVPSRTGTYYNRQIWRLSTPLDLLRFRPLSLIDRIRLGLLVLQVRQVRDWRAIEHLSIREWLEPLCGRTVFRVIWQPLLEHKFAGYADDISAVWMWKKLALRGGTRNRRGVEQLSYFRGGFGELARAMADDIVRHGGTIRYGTTVTAARSSGEKSAGESIVGLVTADGDEIVAREYLLTPAFPLIADWFEGIAPQTWLSDLRRIRYLGNTCLVLELDRSLSETYWLNVNDPGFPFVGVIEHTNFDSAEAYQGRRIVYLSRYMAHDDPLWSYDGPRYLDYAFGHLQRMFPAMQRSWIRDYALWQAPFAQPVTDRGYSSRLPGHETPFVNTHIATMAQIYPEDRGTNYALREGRKVAALIAARLNSGAQAA